MAGRIEWFRLGSTAVSVLTFPYSHPAHVLAHWLERFLLQTDPLQNIKKWFYDSMLRFTESRRDSKKVHRSLWLDCCFGKGEPWVWVLAVRMQNSVWEQWLELKHPFPRWLPLLLDHRLFFVLHFWLRPNASAPMRRVQTDHFSPQQPIILVGNFSEKQRCTFEPSQDGMGTKPRSIPREVL